MLLRIGTLRLNVGSLGPCAQESQREESRWSLVLGLTLSYTQLLEKEISGQKEKKEQYSFPFSLKRLLTIVKIPEIKYT